MHSFNNKLTLVAWYTYQHIQIMQLLMFANLIQ